MLKTVDENEDLGGRNVKKLWELDILSHKTF